jgi:hypothetical protein
MAIGPSTMSMSMLPQLPCISIFLLPNKHYHRVTTNACFRIELNSPVLSGLVWSFAPPSGLFIPWNPGLAWPGLSLPAVFVSLSLSILSCLALALGVSTIHFI